MSPTGLLRRIRNVVWLALIGLSPSHALTPSQVLILVNRDTPISSAVAQMYQKLRGVPQENVLRLYLGAERQISREQYLTRISPPVRQYLTTHPGIQCILTTSGFPYVIGATPGTEDGASVDNELAAVLRPEPKDWNRWQPNPLYLRGQNPYGAADARLFQMVYVSRLDGPDLRTITRMVEDAVAVDATGLEGPVFGDAMGLDGNAGTAAADFSIRAAIDRLSGAGFPATLDLNQADWKQPPGGVGDQAAGAAFYIGWYNLQNFQDIFGKLGLARGAIAWHIASDEAVDIWSPNSREWCVNLIRHGAAVTLGPAFEPYVSAFPNGEIMVESLLLGRSVAESYWLSLPHVSWAMVLLGDPLYRPFAAKPRPALIARAYSAVNASHVLQAGETSPLLVQVQCVGPAGSGCSSLAAKAEPGAGLGGASGMVAIPALHAGETAVVQVPSVKAPADPTGMFRLHLVPQGNAESERRVVLEGRTGFSLIGGGIERQTQMFASPAGGLVIGGVPGATLLTEIASLRSKRWNISEGWAIVSAAFSLDARHVLLSLLNPSKKETALAIADVKQESIRVLPSGNRFLRWLDDRTLLVKSPTGLAQYDIVLGASLPVFQPEGWTVDNIIPGTAIQFLIAKDGRFAVKNGQADLLEVLPGAGVTRDRAVADDLSQAGGVDGQKRLWVQRGLQSKPEIVAQDVSHVLWGPVSRRALVEGAGGEFRIYDGRKQSWTSLPPMVAAQWSPDESRLLYVEAERRPEGMVPRFLSLWDGEQSVQLCSFDRIGEIAAMAITRDHGSAFLLAGGNAGLQIWMIALPKASLGK